MKTTMNKADAIYQLSKISCERKEDAHIDADDILLTFLADNGHKDLADAYHALNARCGEFWYA